MKVTSGEHTFYMDGYMKHNLDIVLLEAIPAKWDVLSLYTGREGVGKSTKMAQDALYLDPRLTLDHCTFTPYQFIDAIDYAKDESSIILDEAITVANAQAHAQQIVISIISKLTQIRKKRLKIFLGFPYLNMLNKYFVRRCLYSCHIYAHDFKDRGYFRFYSQPKTSKLHYLMKTVFPYDPDEAYKKVSRNFYGRFTKYFPFDEKEYDDKKEYARKNWQKESGLWRDRFFKTVQLIKTKTDLPVSRVAEEIGLTRQTLYEQLKKAVDNA